MQKVSNTTLLPQTNITGINLTLKKNVVTHSLPQQLVKLRLIYEKRRHKVEFLLNK